MQVKYSIIVPHKNDFNNLKRLVHSIQSLEDSEIIVVDDHSSVTVKDNLNSLGDQFSNVIIENCTAQGAGAARNYGISLARGKWLIFADSDDCFDEQASQILPKFFESDSDVVYFRPKVEVVKRNDYRLFLRRLFDQYFSNPIMANEWSIRLNFDVPWSKMIKRKYIKENGFGFSRFLKQEDTMFSEMVGINAHFVQISKYSIYKVVDRASSTSHKVGKNFFESQIDAIIASYVYKENNVSDNRLIKSDKIHFHEPLYAVLWSFKHYRNWSYSLDVYSKFKKRDIPVFTFRAYKSLIQRYASYDA
ncbi:glycosyltransferase family 2 protein [Oenococcus kitaharae]|uniref:Putative polyribitolphosphotransferase n=1 Tax=Oenococcus kitaharae DSM 17330 TaxID=1045004 RepID=G9WIQ3_9LACO|nr:glycosyltransferase family 2 protein [Oenococcus kitaharae]EHN58192.1 Putative polyribitolphosphotransferase [Oenococcus kitaharae DSM 17330]